MSSPPLPPGRFDTKYTISFFFSGSIVTAGMLLLNFGLLMVFGNFSGSDHLPSIFSETNIAQIILPSQFGLQRLKYIFVPSGVIVPLPVFVPSVLCPSSHSP